MKGRASGPWEKRKSVAGRVSRYGGRNLFCERTRVEAALSAHALHKDEAGRRITEATAGPLFADQAADGDEWHDLRAAEQVLIFRSFQSTAIHKIGVTSGSGQERIAGARSRPPMLHHRATRNRYAPDNASLFADAPASLEALAVVH